jgi:hypothetical protein
MGTTDYDFTLTPITLSAEIINPLGVKDTASVFIQTGNLNANEWDTVEIMSSLFTAYSGAYKIKVWISRPTDYIVYDNTIVYDYVVNRIGLPLNEDFSNSVLPIHFFSIPVIGSDVWEPCMDSSVQIAPPSGNGILQYVGLQGTIAHLTTKQLDLIGTVDPKMDFWYYHDSTTNVLDNSYTEVRVIVDGVTNNVLTLFRRSVTHGWKQYSVDLKPYVNAQCVIIQFESMNKYDSNSAQYIGHVLIESEKDLKVSEIILSPEVSVCDSTDKELKVVITTVTNQAIDFYTDTTHLAVAVSGYPVFYHALQGIINGNASDTVLISSGIRIPLGATTVNAWLTSPVDKNPLNDTAILTIDVSPELTVKVNSITNGKDCFKKGTAVYQPAIVRNTGNRDLSGIALMLIVSGTHIDDTIKDAGTIDLPMGDTVLYQFNNPYIVPGEASYQVQVIASVDCLPTQINSRDKADECMDMHNLAVISIDRPVKGQTDNAGSTDSITITVENTDDLNPFEKATVTTLIEDEHGQVLETLTDIIPFVSALSTASFTFQAGYTVPALPVYSIRTYLTESDNYPEDDTVFVQRETNVGISEPVFSNVFALRQNVPNPANNTTRIDYTVPEAGKAVFQVHSVSGQLLYSAIVETTSGNNSITLHTDRFASGVYFYSIEHQNQRIVKRMIVQQPKGD